jgi:alcohol dehydrogenase
MYGSIEQRSPGRTFRTSDRMKALQLESPRTFRQLEIAEPSSPGPSEALVRTHRMGVCGTDPSAYLGKFPLFS